MEQITRINFFTQLVFTLSTASIEGEYNLDYSYIEEIFNYLLKEEKDKIYIILCAKILISLIEYYKKTKDYKNNEENKLKLMLNLCEKKIKYNLDILNQYNLELDDIKNKSIDEIYYKIITKELITKNFENYNDFEKIKKLLIKINDTSVVQKLDNFIKENKEKFEQYKIKDNDDLESYENNKKIFFNYFLFTISGLKYIDPNYIKKKKEENSIPDNKNLDAKKYMSELFDIKMQNNEENEFSTTIKSSNSIYKVIFEDICNNKLYFLKNLKFSVTYVNKKNGLESFYTNISYKNENNDKKELSSTDFEQLKKLAELKRKKINHHFNTFIDILISLTNNMKRLKNIKERFQITLDFYFNLINEELKYHYDFFKENENYRFSCDNDKNFKNLIPKLEKFLDSDDSILENPGPQINFMNENESDLIQNLNNL